MIKLVAFDWNGTLFADTYTIFKAAKTDYLISDLGNLINFRGLIALGFREVENKYYKRDKFLK